MKGKDTAPKNPLPLRALTPHVAPQMAHIFHLFSITRSGAAISPVPGTHTHTRLDSWRKNVFSISVDSGSSFQGCYGFFFLLLFFCCWAGWTVPILSRASNPSRLVHQKRVLFFCSVTFQTVVEYFPSNRPRQQSFRPGSNAAVYVWMCVCVCAYIKSHTNTHTHIHKWDANTVRCTVVHMDSHSRNITRSWSEDAPTGALALFCSISEAAITRTRLMRVILSYCLYLLASHFFSDDRYWTARKCAAC